MSDDIPEESLDTLNKELIKAKILTEQKKAEADQKKAEAELIKAHAEAAKHTAEIERFKAETQLKLLEVAASTLRLSQDQRRENDELAENKYHFVYTFNGIVNDSSVKECIHQLTAWTHTHPKQDIEIIFNSPGGGIIAGMALFDFIQHLRKDGHFITTTALGMAASMAGILLQAGDQRVIGRETWLLIHEASFAAIGKVGEIDDTVEWVKRIQKRILQIFASRSNLTVGQIARRWKRKDWWISSDECLKYKFVDEIQ